MKMKFWVKAGSVKEGLTQPPNPLWIRPWNWSVSTGYNISALTQLQKSICFTHVTVPTRSAGTNLVCAASSEKVPSKLHKMRRFGSCTCATYYPGICSTFIHSVISNDSVNGQWRPWSACADAQADLGLRCPHMPENLFSHGEVYFTWAAQKCH